MQVESSENAVVRFFPVSLWSVSVIAVITINRYSGLLKSIETNRKLEWAGAEILMAKGKSLREERMSNPL